MAIVRWEPFRGLLASQREFDRLFREAFSPALSEGEVSTACAEFLRAKNA